MQVIPAIDVLEGRVVRLQQGDFARVADYGDAPVTVAESLAAEGATRLHLVNLSGAKDGRQEQEFLDVLGDIAKRTQLSLQVGGGIRSIRDISAALEAGASRIVLGTVLFTDTELVRNALLLFGSKRLVAALDVRGGRGSYSWMARWQWRLP